MKAKGTVKPFIAHDMLVKRQHVSSSSSPSSSKHTRINPTKEHFGHTLPGVLRFVWARFIRRPWTPLVWLVHHIKWKGIPVLMINMELRNGHFDTFLVDSRNHSFEYEGGTYVFDDPLKYIHNGTGLWAFDFHQDMSMPVKRKIDITSVQESIVATGQYEFELATNPSNLKQFIESKIVSEVLQAGQMIETLLKRITVVGVILIIMVLVNLILSIAQSGLFKAKPA